MKERDYLWCLLNQLLDDQEELDQLCPTCRAEAEQERCPGCGAIHRELGGLFFPYKQYEAEVIFGVLEGLITCETLGFEDYPCEMTMLRWLSQKAQLLLWRNP